MLNGAVGASSFITALMFYAGIMHSSAYYSYFRLNVFALGLGLPQVVIWSLRLLTFPLMITLAVVALASRAPEIAHLLHIPGHVTARVRRFGTMAARLSPAMVAAGVLLMVLWQHIQPYGWSAPLLVALGLAVGQTDAANSAPPGRGWWRKGLPVAVAGLCLVWAIALVAGQLGAQDARKAATHLNRRTAVVALSTERLSITGPGIVAEDLGKGAHYRYRYSGLRLLFERDRIYFVLPLGWHHRTDATYIIEDDDTIRIELLPGTQPRS
ncbi:MAG TPA: hypothetical protein VFH94_06110 [Streptomyces sp.]|nr:hypothetical protein [Streptomyces sp.]